MNNNSNNNKRKKDSEIKLRCKLQAFDKYKKIIIVFIIISSVLISSCSKNSVTEVQSIDPINESKEIIPEQKDTLEIDEDSIIASEVVNSILSTYLYPNISLYIAAEIKNTSEIPIKISDVSFDIENSEGKFIKHLGTGININPNIIEPGKSGYIAKNVFYHDLESDISSEEYYKLIVNYKIEETEFIDNNCVVEDINFISYSGKFIGITGRVKNNSDSTAERIIVSHAMYNEENKLLGVITSKPIDIEPNSKIGFEAVDQVINETLINKDEVSYTVTTTSRQ